MQMLHTVREILRSVYLIDRKIRDQTINNKSTNLIVNIHNFTVSYIKMFYFYFHFIGTQKFVFLVLCENFRNRLCCSDIKKSHKLFDRGQKSFIIYLSCYFVLTFFFCHRIRHILESDV